MTRLVQFHRICSFRVTFLLFVPFTFCLAKAPLRSQEGLVRPEPCHLAQLVLSGGTGPGWLACWGPLEAILAGGEDAFALWRLQEPPGLTTPLLLGSLIGISSSQPALGGAALPTVISLLDMGHQYGNYQIVDPGRVLPLSDFLLDQVRDREPIGEADFGAYLQAVTQSGRVTFEAFWNAGNSGLTRGDLMNRSNRVRGTVVRGQGVVRRIRKLEPLEGAVKNGVPELYEAWIFQDLYGANPVCVVTARLGGGLVPAEKLQRQVRFTGYFLKAYRYQSAQTAQGKPLERECPLLVGPELLGLTEPQTPRPRADMGNWPRELLGIILGVFALALVLVWGMTWWMGRADRRVRSRLEALKRSNRPENMDPMMEKMGPVFSWPDTRSSGQDGGLPPGK
jgi:hypothetical protein